MDARAVVVVAVVFMVLLGGAGYAVFKNQIQKQPTQPSASPQINTSPSMEPSPSTSQMMSLKDIWSKGTSQKCIVSDISNKTTGTIYVSQGKMKGDFSASAAATGSAITSHVIVENQQSYVWVDGQNNGMKIAVNSGQIGKQASSSSQFNLDQKYQVKCETWNQDDKMFTIPQNVTFQDMSALLPKSTGTPPPIDLKAACGACDKLSGSAKDQCRSALSC